MRSAATKLGEIVDCRQVKLLGTYYSLPSETADRLVHDFYTFLMERLSENCVLYWSTSPRKVALSDQIALYNFQKQFGVYDFYLYGYVKSEIVYNKKTYKEFERYKTHPANSLRAFPGGDMSIDYTKYYYRNVKPYARDPVSYKKALLRLFDLEGRVHLGEYYTQDIHGSCWKYKQKGADNLFLGEFSLEAGFYCLGEEADTWAERMLKFGKQLSEKYENVNIQIEINPSSKAYARYYGEYLKRGPLDQNDSLLQACATHLYFTGVGWAHIASPATLELETVRFVDPKSDTVHEEKLANGARMIRVNTPISGVRIYDLKDMKRHIYSLIMPRKNKPGVQERPRCYWEMIPVFDNELTIIDGEFHLEHKGNIDQQKVYDLMRVKPLE